MQLFILVLAITVTTGLCWIGLDLAERATNRKRRS